MDERLHDDAVFRIAFAIESPELRTEYLRQVGAYQPDVRDRVQTLLEASREEPDFLEPPASSFCQSLEMVVSVPDVGSKVGSYALREQIGEGGMGVVFVAEQIEPVRREVALKIIKPGMATQDVIARFEAERQTLAMMDHPNIARILDGGVTDTGQPYFVMELVQGVTIVEYCDQCELQTRDRLKLFMTVCHAVQHAHQKGIIHRDLKPSNILIAVQDGQPAPKIIDFGIAKAIDQQPFAKQAATTGFAKMIGTPLYMSPEQAELSSLGVDLRSDIYSLGVLLYELLVGTTPFDRERLKTEAHNEVRRIIREEELLRPSARLSTIAGEAASTVAQRRRTDTRRLQQTVQGDLDWIAMKCLEKDRTRRYETASELARDINRYLQHEPVEACPPSVGYRISKFVRRNTGTVIAASLVLLCLVGGIVGTTAGMMYARRERDAAQISEQVAREQKQKAEQAVEAERAILDFVDKRILAAARPTGHDGGLGYNTTIRQAVEMALPYVQGGFADQPLVRARLHSTIGKTFQYLGDYDVAQHQLEAALSICSSLLGPDRKSTVEITRELTYVYDLSEKPDEAYKLRQDLYVLQKATLGPDHPETAISLGGIGLSHKMQGRHDEATKCFETALKLLSNIPESSDAYARSRTAIMVNLVHQYRLLGRLQDTVNLHEQALESFRSIFGDDHPDTLMVKHDLAHTYQMNRRYEDAHELLQETWKQQKDQLGPDHPWTLKTGHCLAKSHSTFGRYAAACQLHEEILAHWIDRLGPDHRESISSQYNLAIAYFGMGRRKESHDLQKKVLARSRAILGEDDRLTMSSLHEVALGHCIRGQYDQGIPAFQELLARFQEKHGGDNKITLGIMANLARTFVDANQIEQAVALAKQMNEIWGQQYGIDDPDPQRLRFLAKFASELTEVADDEHQSLARDFAQIAVDAAPNNGPYRRTLGFAQLRAGDFEDAIKSIEQARMLNDGGGWDYLVLAIAEAKRGHSDAGRIWYDKAVEWMEQNESGASKLKGLRSKACEELNLDETETPSLQHER